MDSSSLPLKSSTLDNDSTTQVLHRALLTASRNKLLLDTVGMIQTPKSTKTLDIVIQTTIFCCMVKFTLRISSCGFWQWLFSSHLKTTSLSSVSWRRLLLFLFIREASMKKVGLPKVTSTKHESRPTLCNPARRIPSKKRLTLQKRKKLERSITPCRIDTSLLQASSLFTFVLGCLKDLIQTPLTPPRKWKPLRLSIKMK